jgi:hypothetical protein
LAELFSPSIILADWLDIKILGVVKVGGACSPV